MCALRQLAAGLGTSSMAEGRSTPRPSSSVSAAYKAVTQVKCVMQEVATTAGALGWAGLHVQPLGVSAALQGARRGQASTEPGQLRQQLLQLLGQNGGTHTQQTPVLMACLQVCCPSG